MFISDKIVLIVINQNNFTDDKVFFPKKNAIILIFLPQKRKKRVSFYVFKIKVSGGLAKRTICVNIRRDESGLFSFWLGKLRSNVATKNDDIKYKRRFKTKRGLNKHIMSKHPNF